MNINGPKIKKMIRDATSTQDVKVNLKVTCTYVKESIKSWPVFKTKNKAVLGSTDINLYYDKATEKIIAESEEYEAKESGWRFESVDKIDICINRYNPMRGSSFLPLPAALAKKKAIINVENKDMECFRWAILSALHHDPQMSHPERIGHYVKYRDSLNFKGIEFPMKVDDVPRFAERHGISINVYSWDEKHDVYPRKISDDEKATHIDLLYLTNDDEINTSHYCWIKDLSRLVSRQLSNHDGRKFICKRCLLFFNDDVMLKRHQFLCKTHAAVRVELPEEGENILKFKNIQNMLRVPFVVYADFECLTVPVSGCQPNNESSFMSIYQKHVPMSFCYYIVSSQGTYKEPVVYRGLDAPQKFVEMMVEEARVIDRIYQKVTPMSPLDAATKLHHEGAQTCYLCMDEFTQEDWKVHDHCHISGAYRGAAHNTCNLKLRSPDYLPIVFHNLASYDAHIFVRELGFDEQPIMLIPTNTEKYISFSKRISKTMSLRFLDSFKFMPASLDSLANNLKKEQCKHTLHHFPAEKVELMLKKGVYPYDYMSSLSKCDETSLPPRHQFYNQLNDCEISEVEYEHACEVWRVFNIQDLGQYTDLYVKTDVLLLSDIFENFRDVCMGAYRLDPTYYYTAPGLSWDAMMKSTRQEIELITDYDMLLFVESGIRGGISQCSNRMGIANNKYMMTGFNPEEPSSYLLYLDANNLYGWAMSQPLPTGQFEWAEPLDVRAVPDDSSIGYILEVDLDYPKRLHNQHSDLPFAPKNEVPPGCREPRLMTTLHNKTRYVIHYRVLKQCLEHGLELKNTHRVLKFHQAPWLRSYIETNTALRTQAEDDFSKDFFKLMNNSIFGKTMENIRRRVDIRLCTSSKQAEKLVAKPNFHKRTIFSETLVAVQMTKTRLLFNKPIAVGMCILELSKELMYSFHYDTMKPLYNDNIKLLYMDTDSFIYHIFCEDAYVDIKTNIQLYDTSDYAETNPYEMPRINRKVIGKMKDENKGLIMTRFVGLKSKMYAFKVDKQTPTKKLKGIKKSTLKHKISYEDYEECLKSGKHLYASMNLIRSKAHNLHSIQVNKLALSRNDAKRYILADGISTLAWGHKDIPV